MPISENSWTLVDMLLLNSFLSGIISSPTRHHGKTILSESICMLTNIFLACLQNSAATSQL
jgi:hypothetical protein